MDSQPLTSWDTAQVGNAQGNSPTSRLEVDSLLIPVGPDSFDTVIHPDWGIGTSANGGYLLSVALRALGQRLPLPDPLTATAHFMRPVENGEARLEIEIIKIGRTLARGAVRVLQGGQECARIVAAFGQLPETPGEPLYSTPPSFEIAPLEDCTPLVLDTPGSLKAPVRARLDARYDPQSVGWARGTATGKPELKAWVRAADGSEPDRHLIPIVADALPCTAFDLGISSRVATVEITVHQRAVPAAGWLRVAFTSRLVGDGFMEEDSEIWDSAGNLVAMSRQLAILPRER